MSSAAFGAPDGVTGDANSSPARPRRAQTPARLFAEGRRQLELGAIDEAVRSLTLACQMRPLRTDYRIVLGETLLAAEQWDRAEDVFRRLVRTRAHETRVRTGLARVFAGRRQCDRVIRALLPLREQLACDALATLVNALEHEDHAELDRTVARARARFPDEVAFHLAWVDAALRNDRPMTALDRIASLRDAGIGGDALQFRAARAYLAQGRLLGSAELQVVQGGKIGQFRAGVLLVERRPEPDSFLVASEDSALACIRRALDAGVDDPGAHVLHARIWQRLGRADLAREILAGQQTRLLEQGSDADLTAYADVALDAGDAEIYIAAMRQRARRDTVRSDELLRTAFMRTAELCARRGDSALHLQWLYRAALIAPADADLWLAVGDAAWLNERFDTACEAYRRVMDLAPTQARAAEILRRIGDCPPESAKNP